MDSPALGGVENIAGRALGTIGVLGALRGGGLMNYMNARARALSDPATRATLEGSPFTSGLYWVGGGYGGDGGSVAPPGQPMPAAGGVAKPEEVQPGPYASGYVFPSDGGVAPPVAPPAAQQVAVPSANAFAIPGYEPGTARSWHPYLTPYAPEEALKEQARATMLQGVASNDLGQRAQYKMAAGIPLTQQEYGAALGLGAAAVRAGGAGTTVQLDVPGMKTQVGSPYNFSAITSEEYPTFELATAAANARNAGLTPGSPGWRVVPSGRGSFLLTPPPTREQVLPTAPPAPAIRGEQPGTLPAPKITGQTSAPPAPTVPITPGPTAAAQPPGGGNTVAIRNNNPGNITASPATLRYPGVVGTETVGSRTFLTFESPESGYNAMERLLQGPGYRDLPVDDAMRRWTTGTTKPTFDEQGRPQGYDLPAMTGRLGIDPSQSIASLSPDQRSALVREMSVREGFSARGGGAPRPSGVTVAATPPPSRPSLLSRITPGGTAYAAEPPPGATVEAPPAFDPNATVPHVIVPAPVPAGATVGYPSPAPEPGPGTIVPAPIPRLRTPGAPVGIPGAPPPAAELPGVAVDPNTGLPLQSRTYESQTGSETFTAPPRGDVHTQLLLRYNGVTDPAIATPAQVVNYFATEQALKNNESMDKATIERMQRGMTEGESKEFTRLTEMKAGINDFLKAYPDPADRAKFLGLITAPLQTIRERIGWQDAGAIRDFRNAFSPFSLESLTDEKGKPVPGMEGIAQMAPSVQDSAGAFESNLQHFKDALDRRITIVSNLRAMPVGEATPALVNSWVDQLQHDSLAQRLSVFPQTTAPPAAPPPAVAAPPPPSAPPPPTATAPPWQPNWVQ